MLTDSDLRIYRMARKLGYSPRTALYAVRPPVIEYVGRFTWKGERFVGSFIPADDWSDCGCGEMVEAFREYGEDPDGRSPVATLDPDKAEHMDHQHMRVRLAGTDFETVLGGVCTGYNADVVGTRLDERYLAETAVELAEEVLDQRNRAEDKDMQTRMNALTC